MESMESKESEGVEGMGSKGNDDESDESDDKEESEESEGDLCRIAVDGGEREETAGKSAESEVLSQQGHVLLLTVRFGLCALVLCCGHPTCPLLSSLLPLLSSLFSPSLPTTLLPSSVSPILPF